MADSARFTSTIAKRDITIKFRDDSKVNRDRIMYINWTLTDRYSDISMDYDNRGKDNKQEWLNVDKDEEISTTINSNEDHILTQEVHWDNGFYEEVFTTEHTVKTLNSDINVDFSYSQIYLTGPEIRFANESTANDYSVLLSYELLLYDEDNDGNNTDTEFIDIALSDTVDYTYKSVSNSPFEEDEYNKSVKITVWYDDGWDEVQDNYNDKILVKPNRIIQDFITTPLRNSADTETEDNIITGNNPISFKDNSNTIRVQDNNDKDFSFIKHVKYKVQDTCD